MGFDSGLIVSQGQEGGLPRSNLTNDKAFLTLEVTMLFVIWILNA
jgi:hypothetical protein